MSEDKLRMRLAENDKSEVESMLNVAMESNFSSIMLTSATDGFQIKYVNPAFTELTGYMPEDVIGKDPSLLHGPKTDRSLLYQLRQQLTRGETFHGKTVNYRKDGSEFMMEWKIYPIKNDKQKTTFFMAIQRDG